MDNCASKYLSTCSRYFVGVLVPCHCRVKEKGGYLVRDIRKGTSKWQIKGDDGAIQNILIPNSYYVLEAVLLDARCQGQSFKTVGRERGVPLNTPAQCHHITTMEPGAVYANNTIGSQKNNHQFQLHSTGIWLLHSVLCRNSDWWWKVWQWASMWLTHINGLPEKWAFWILDSDWQVDLSGEASPTPQLVHTASISVQDVLPTHWALEDRRAVR